jgi:hypothetical protein
MAHVHMYAVTYDLGFAPNPFGGLCSLACCKPEIRRTGKLGDWVVGLTGTKLPPALRLVFAMQVTRISDFDKYWGTVEFAGRKAARNGSLKAQVGDNIYHRDAEGAPWIQENSVHSLPGGAQCDLNTAHDTRVNRILLSDRFIYLGDEARAVPPDVLQSLGYEKNARDRRKFTTERAACLIDWIEGLRAAEAAPVVGDPINFDATGKTFSYIAQKMV